MSHNDCQKCLALEASQNTICRLFVRLFKALIGRTPPPSTLPRFYCTVCEKFVPESNVTRLHLSVEEDTRPCDGAHHEGAGGLMDSYLVRCHGAEAQENITIVRQLVGSLTCHETVYFRTEGPRLPRKDFDWQHSIERAANDPKVIAYKTNIQAQIARANAERKEYLDKMHIGEKLAELKQALSTHPLFNVDRPGEMTDMAADILHDDVYGQHKEKAKKADKDEDTFQAAGNVQVRCPGSCEEDGEHSHWVRKEVAICKGSNCGADVRAGEEHSKECADEYAAACRGEGEEHGAIDLSIDIIGDKG
jgi:hypothetical protein